MRKNIPITEKNKCLKLETLVENKLYAITISPSDIRDADTSRANAARILTDFKQKIEEHIKWIHKLTYCELILYPELSPTGRLHFHGFIKFKDLFKFYWKDLYYLQCKAVFEIDTLSEDYEQKYLPYVKKQETIIRPIIEATLGEGQYPICT